MARISTHEKLRIPFVKIVELCKHHENIGAGMNFFFFSLGGGEGGNKRITYKYLF